jgi:FAD:protein FMN transferase
MTKKLFILAAGLFLSLAACVSRKNQEIRLSGEAQGSTYSIIYVDADMRNLQPSMDSIFQMIDMSMSTWASASMISRLNKGEAISPDTHFKKVLDKSAEIYRLSKGIFDPTVGPLIEAWGFGFKKHEAIPDSLEINRLKNLVGLDKVDLESNFLKLPEQGMRMDFNAIAQGYTVDVIADFLNENGISDFMIEVGGEIRTSGLNKNNKSWRIGIDKPVDIGESRPLQVIIKLSDKALATSGSYRKYRMDNGIRYSHAVNPLTGWPVEHSLLSVSVIGDTCMDVDAWATVFLILGVEQSKAIIAPLNLEAYFISESGDGKLKIDMTDGFQSYILEDVFE